MAIFLKTGSTDAEKAEENNSIKSAVEATLSKIEKHGDAAVVELSKQFDDWAPQTFRLSQKDIDACLKELTEENIKDIEFTLIPCGANSTPMALVNPSIACLLAQ